jgi:ATP-dependent protease ClpP protease subunit
MMESVGNMKKWLAGVMALLLLMLATPEYAKADLHRVGKTEFMIVNRVNALDHVQFYAETSDYKPKRMTIYIDTPGGLADVLVHIVNRMRELKAQGVRITTVLQVEGFSAGGLIFLEGDERIMHMTGTLMIHEIVVVNGKGEDITETYCKEHPQVGKSVDRLNRWMYSTLSKLLNKPKKEVEAMINGRRGLYLSAPEALVLGLATRIKD